MLQLLDPANDVYLIELLTSLGVIAVSQQCKFCGGPMRKFKEKIYWYWICTRRVNGVKCNRGKYSIRQGTVLDEGKLSMQNILLIFWNFVHRLTEQQCKDYVGISKKTNHTVVDWYRTCREVCTDWIWDNTPMLGGYGKIVEMDESYFAGAPKYNRGRRLGTSWDEQEIDKWGFCLTERGRLDCVITQVDASRSRRLLLPIIQKHTLPGSIFCSDGWKAYHSLAEHLDLEDVVHFPVNHSQNYVNPETGAHTQTVEGVWRHCKDFLPSFGLKPKDLHTYIGTFMWYRYCKERKLDMFKHFLVSAASKFPPSRTNLPSGQAIERPVAVVALDNIDDQEQVIHV